MVCLPINLIYHLSFIIYLKWCVPIQWRSMSTSSMATIAFGPFPFLASKNNSNLDDVKFFTFTNVHWLAAFRGASQSTCMASWVIILMRSIGRSVAKTILSNWKLDNIHKQQKLNSRWNYLNHTWRSKIWGRTETKSTRCPMKGTIAHPSAGMWTWGRRMRTCLERKWTEFTFDFRRMKRQGAG